MNKKPVKMDLLGPASALAVFTVLTNVLLLVMPLYMTQVYDRILPTHSVETLIYLSIMAGAALGLFGLIETVRQTLARKLAARYELTVLPYLISGSDSWVSAIDPQLASKVGSVKRFVSSSAYINLYDLPFAPLFLLLMFLVHPLLGALTAAGMVLLALVTLMNEWLSRRASAAASAQQSIAARYAEEALGAHEDLRAMGMGPAMVTRWLGSALYAADATDRAGAVQARFYGLSRFIRQTLQMATLGFGAWLVIRGNMSPGLIFASSIVSARALMPIEQLVGASKVISEARKAKRDIDTVINQVGATTDARVDLPSPAGHVSARNVKLALGAGSDAPLIVNDVSIDFAPGQISVIVGPSGSGKSTLLRLLCGAGLPSGGEIRLDGFRLSEWPTKARGQAFGYMAQQTKLFEGSVAQNIARFDLAASDSSIVEAARRAHAHEFISTLPQGYNTRIGPRGVRLSGGQAQRIALARALHTQPAVLVLDEPNSNLDSAGEDALIQVLVEERAVGRTIIAVTHRSSLLAIANTVYLMEKGKVRLANSPVIARGQMLTVSATPSGGAQAGT